MTFKKEKIDKREIINRVLLNHKKISEAPRCLSDFPGFWECKKEALSEFEQRCEAEEAAKEYKAVDEFGNIYLVKNPWHQRGLRPQPQFVFTYDQAVSEAVSTKVTRPLLPAPTFTGEVMFE